MEERFYGTDVEGPLAKNDNAQELSVEFIPNGGEFFEKLSKYDDFLADVMHVAGYKAGDTLRLILPFFRLYGVTDEMIREYSAKHILLVPGAKEMLEYIRGIMPTVMISTSYRPYIEALCGVIGFPFENAYCTQLKLDGYALGYGEIAELERRKQEIDQMPILDWPDDACFCGDLSLEMQKIAIHLDYIFWERITQMPMAGRMLTEVNPIGGFEKAKAMEDFAEKHGLLIGDSMYAGDSITDVEAMKLVKEKGGVTISFNGNGYAIETADIAVISGNAIVMEYIAYVFKEEGIDGVMRLGEKRRDGKSVFQQLISVDTRLIDNFAEFEIITDDNRDALIQTSEKFRKTVRGKKIGSLG